MALWAVEGTGDKHVCTMVLEKYTISMGSSLHERQEQPTVICMRMWPVGSQISWLWELPNVSVSVFSRFPARKHRENAGQKIIIKLLNVHRHLRCGRCEGRLILQELPWNVSIRQVPAEHRNRRESCSPGFSGAASAPEVNETGSTRHGSNHADT